MVAHFVRGHSPNCTFCDIQGNQDEDPETPLHLLYSCEPVAALIDSIFSWLLGEPVAVSRQDYFVSFNRQQHRKNGALNLVSMLVKKFIWDCKLRFTLPSLLKCKIFIFEEVQILRHVSIKARKVFENAELFMQLG